LNYDIIKEKRKRGRSMEGYYVPTEQDIEECKTGKGCSFGICDECKVLNSTKSIKDDLEVGNEES
jgi:hypothetical protein